MMKKIVATIATGFMIAGVAGTSVSAQSYEVQQGENLWKIAKQHNTTVDHLMEVNNLNDATIHPNQKLNINDNNKPYIVEKGDTLFKIAKEVNVSIHDLKQWNNLQSDVIVVGQELELNGASSPKKQEKLEKPAVQEQSTKSEQPTRTQNTSKANEQSTASKTATENKEPTPSPEGKTISVSATAYTASCDGCTGVTATGVDLNKNPNSKVIAVDPKVIPLGTKVHVEGYGYATAADVGSAIKGNKIDVYVPTKKEAVHWGVRTVNVTIVE